jgi:hypothetical protein
VWRWPNLQSHHELKPIPECRFPYDSRSDNICINPYHYIRVELQQPRSPLVPTPHLSQQPFSHPTTNTPPLNYNYHQQSPFSHTSTPSPFSLSHNGFNGFSQMPSHSGLNHEMMDTQFASPYSSSTATIQSPSQFNSVATPSTVLSDDDEFVVQNPIADNCTMGEVEKPEPDYWCTIFYYELNSRVGEPFMVSTTDVVVDGFTHPSQDQNRICLGLLSNVNRNVTIENTRRHIGKGVRLICSDTLVEVYNLSQFPVFVQSRNSNFKYHLHPTSVCRVRPGISTVVFDYQLFHNVSF